MKYVKFSDGEKKGRKHAVGFRVGNNGNLFKRKAFEFTQMYTALSDIWYIKSQLSFSFDMVPDPVYFYC